MQIKQLFMFGHVNAKHIVGKNNNYNGRGFTLSLLLIEVQCRLALTYVWAC